MVVSSQIYTVYRIIQLNIFIQNMHLEAQSIYLHDSASFWITGEALMLACF